MALYCAASGSQIPRAWLSNSARMALIWRVLNNGTVVSTTYDYKGKNFLGTPRYSESRQIIDCLDYNSQPADALMLQAISYNSTTKTPSEFGDRYDYAYGSEGTKTYLKISCNATYQIRTDNLAQTKKDNCNAYTNSIKK